MALITLDHITKVYPRSTRPALSDVTLSIERGEFVFLVGASGSGKTTLLSLLLAEEDATEGEIRVAGNDLRRIPNRQIPRYRRSIGFVFQDYKLLENKTVWQNVAFALEVLGHSRSTIKSLVPQALKTVGLTGKEERLPQELSGGEAQRVAIARAYVNHPQIILADEPTGNLDPTTSVGIMEVLEAVNRTGTTVVMATHNEEIVNSMRKRVIELHEGVVVRDERSGSYDSSVYYPDADVESAALDANGQATIRMAREADADEENRVPQVSVPDPAAEDEGLAGLARLAGGEGNGDASAADTSSPAERTGDFRARAAAPARTAYRGTEDSFVPMPGGAPSSGIARLAQSVHSGRTGRYGEAFVSVEDTLTWGKGLPKVGGRHSGHHADGRADDAAAAGDGDAYDRFRRHDGGDAANAPLTAASGADMPAAGAPQDGGADGAFAIAQPTDTGSGDEGLSALVTNVEHAAAETADAAGIKVNEHAASTEAARAAAAAPASIPEFLRETESWTPIDAATPARSASPASAAQTAAQATVPAHDRINAFEDEDGDLHPPLPPEQPETSDQDVAPDQAIAAEDTNGAIGAAPASGHVDTAVTTDAEPARSSIQTSATAPSPSQTSATHRISTAMPEDGAYARNDTEQTAGASVSTDAMDSAAPVDTASAQPDIHMERTASSDHASVASASSASPAPDATEPTPIPAHPHAPINLPDPDVEQAAKAMPGMAAALASLAAEAQGAANVGAAVAGGWQSSAYGRGTADAGRADANRGNAAHEANNHKNAKNANKNKGGRR